MNPKEIMKIQTKINAMAYSSLYNDFKKNKIKLSQPEQEYLQQAILESSKVLDNFDQYYNSIIRQVLSKKGDVIKDIIENVDKDIS